MCHISGARVAESVAKHVLRARFQGKSLAQDHTTSLSDKESKKDFLSKWFKFKIQFQYLMKPRLPGSHDANAQSPNWILMVIP